MPLLLESCTQQGSWEMYFGDISLVAADGTVFPIYNGQAGGPSIRAKLANLDGQIGELDRAVEHALSVPK